MAWSKAPTPGKIILEILSSKSIFDYNDLNTFFDAEPDIEHAYINSSKLTIPDGMLAYLEMFKSTHEN